MEYHIPQEGFGPKTHRGSYHWHYNRDKVGNKKSPPLLPGQEIPGGDCPEKDPTRENVPDWIWEALRDGASLTIIINFLITFGSGGLLAPGS